MPTDDAPKPEPAKAEELHLSPEEDAAMTASSRTFWEDWELDGHPVFKPNFNRPMPPGMPPPTVNFNAVDDAGAVRTVFAVSVVDGGVRVTGDAGAAKRLGIPGDPLRLADGRTFDASADPAEYLVGLVAAYGRGSRMFAVRV